MTLAAKLLKKFLSIFFPICPQEGCWGDAGGSHVGCCYDCWTGRNQNPVEPIIQKVVPVEPQKSPISLLECEHPGCDSTNCRDYIRQQRDLDEDDGDEWYQEPISLCEEHRDGRIPFIPTQLKDRFQVYHDPNPTESILVYDSSKKN